MNLKTESTEIECYQEIEKKKNIYIYIYIYI